MRVAFWAVVLLDVFKLKQFVEETYGFWKRKSKNQNGSV
jgi:hypothetical protein